MLDRLLITAENLHRAGRLAEAASVYEQILRSDPNHVKALYALGAIFFQSRQFDRAQYFLGEAVRVNPILPEALNMRGVALLQVQQHQEALSCFDRALSVKPDFVEALSNRGTALFHLGRLDESLAALDAALALDPYHAMSWCNRGNVFVAMRQFQDAMKSYDRALAIQSDFREARDNRKYALGMTYFENAQFEQAQVVLDEAVRLNPLLLDALCIRGIALLRLRRPQEAITCFDHVLATRPNFVEALSNRATAYLELKDFDRALAGFDAVLSIDPRHSVSWNNRGNSLTGLKRYEEAIASYDRALAIQPDFPEARDNRTTALFALGHLQRCPPAYMRALFDDFSSYYDAAMVEGLGYRGHLHLRTLAERALPKFGPPLRILDLGSGTGLVGDAFKDLVRGGRLDGIDLSSGMIEQARRRGIYHDLILGDLETVLAAPGPSYDLILAADTMVYFGDLGPTFSGVARRLEPGGFYLFAVESKDGEGWQQMPVNRFRHSESYLRAEAGRAGLGFLDIMECLLRREVNEPVGGFAVALQKPVAQ